jgi:hypothetical protein
MGREFIQAVWDTLNNPDDADTAVLLRAANQYRSAPSSRRLILPSPGREPNRVTVRLTVCSAPHP